MMSLFLLLSSLAVASPLKIAVVDTGFDQNEADPIPLCKDESYDFVSNKAVVPKDGDGHGTNIAYLIWNTIKNRPDAKEEVCFIIVRYYENGHTPASIVLKRSTDALKHLINKNVTLVNYSGGGSGYYEPEEAAVVKLLDGGVTFVAAAGNEGRDIDNMPTYPAMADSRVVVVGMGASYKERSPASNYGLVVDHWEPGTNLCAGSICLSGTSQSTAAYSGKLVRHMLEEKYSEKRSVKSVTGKREGARPSRGRATGRGVEVVRWAEDFGQD